MAADIFNLVNDAGTEVFGVDGDGNIDVIGTIEAALSMSGGLTLTGTGLTMTGLDIGGTSTEIGNVYIADSKVLALGDGQDDSVVHNATNTIWTHSTGDLTFDNVLVTGSTIMLLGTDTSATDFQVQNNSAAALLTVLGDGVVRVGDSGGLGLGAGDDFQWLHDGTTGVDLTVTANDAGAYTWADSAGTYLTLDTTTGAVSLDLTTRVTLTDGVASGTEKLVGGVAYRAVAASSAITNTTTEALFDISYTIPADTLKAGTVLEIGYQGIATATNGTDTLTIVLYLGGLGGTALLTGTATDVANDNIFTGTAYVTVRTAGTGGTFVAHGSHTDVPAASGTATNVVEIVASTAIDTTATQVVGVGADWGAAATGNSVRLDFLTVKIW